MGEQPDFEALARRYVDLWERQLAETVADPAVTAELGRLFAQMAGMAQAAGLTPPWPRFPWSVASGHAGEDTATGSRTATPQAGSAPAGASYGDGLGGLAELASRLDGVERRLAALEAGSGGGSGGAGRGAKSARREGKPHRPAKG